MEAKGEKETNDVSRQERSHIPRVPKEDLVVGEEDDKEDHDEAEVGEIRLERRLVREIATVHALLLQGVVAV
jgi:hypothetical protein